MFCIQGIVVAFFNSIMFDDTTTNICYLIWITRVIIISYHLKLSDSNRKSKRIVLTIAEIETINNVMSTFFYDYI